MSNIGKYRFSRYPKNFWESRQPVVKNVGYVGPITPAPQVRSTHGGQTFTIPSQAAQRKVVNINDNVFQNVNAPSVMQSSQTTQQTMQQMFMELSGVFEPSRYCDFAMLPVLIGTQDQIVLQPSSSIRAFLFVLNNDLNSTGATIFFGCGQNMNIGGTNGIPLAAGASLFFDTVVPQNDIHLISTLAGCTALIMYGQKSVG